MRKRLGGWQLRIAVYLSALAVVGVALWLNGLAAPGAWPGTPVFGTAQSRADSLAIAEGLFDRVRRHYPEAELYVDAGEDPVFTAAVEDGLASGPPAAGARCPWSDRVEDGDTARAGLEVSASDVDLGRRAARLRVGLSCYTLDARPGIQRSGFASMTEYVLRKEDAVWRVVSRQLIWITWRRATGPRRADAAARSAGSSDGKLT